MRIGIDARLAYRRGVGTYAANLVLALAKTDPRNHYSVFNAPPSLREGVSNRRVQFQDLPFPNAAYYEQVLLPRRAKFLGLDFVHYVDNSGPVLDPFPFLLTLHDAMHVRPLREIRPKPTLRQRLVHAYKQWAIPRSAPRARAVLTVSEFSRGQVLEATGVRPERIFVTPEGVDRSLFKRKRAGKGKGLFKVLVHGAADERKNIPNILKAASILKEKREGFQLVVIGMDERELRCTDYVERVTALGLGRQVEWAGNVPAGMLDQVYAEADLFLYPSRMEGFGLPLLEAFSCGVPVLASNVSSIPEVAGGAALLVDPEDPKALAAFLGRMMGSPSLRAEYAARGAQRVKAFTWERTARLTLAVYEKIGASL